MRLSIRGLASPELPLRVLNLLVVQGIMPQRAVFELNGGDYHLSIDAPVADARVEMIVAKIRAMVLVTSVEVDADVAAQRAAA